MRFQKLSGLCGRAPRRVASHTDILLARHAIVGEERLRDEPKECLRRRLLGEECVTK